MATDQRRSAHTSVSSKTTLVGSSKEAAAIPSQQVPELPGAAAPHPPEVTSADGPSGALPERSMFQTSRLKTSRAYHLIDQLQRRAAETNEAARAASEKARREVRAANTVKPRVASVVGLGSRTGGTSVGSVLSASKQSDRGSGSAVSKEGGNMPSKDGGAAVKQKNTGTGFQDHPFFAKKSPRGTAGEPEMSREEEEALFTASGARAGADGKGRFDRSDRRTATRDLQRSGSPRPRATRAHPKVALQRGLASRMELDGEEANVLWMGSLRGSDIPREEGSQAAKALQRAASARGEGSANLSHKKTMGGVSIREEMGRPRTVSAVGKSRSAAPNMGFLVGQRKVQQPEDESMPAGGLSPSNFTDLGPAGAVVLRGDILKKGKENVHGANEKSRDQEQTVAKKAPTKSANSTAAKVHTSGALTTRARVFSPRKQSPEAPAKSPVEPAALARSSPGKKNVVNAVSGGSKAKPRIGSGEKKSGAQPKSTPAVAGTVQSLSQWPQDVMPVEPVQSPPPELTGVPQYVNVPSLAEFLEPVSVEKPQVFGDEEVGHAANKEVLASQIAAAEDVGNDVHVAVEVEQMRLPDAALQRSSAGSRFSDATEARIRKARQEAKARQAAASDRLSTRTERRNRRSGGAQMEDSMRQLEQNVRQVIATLDVVSNSSRKEDQPSDHSGHLNKHNTSEQHVPVASGLGVAPVAKTVVTTHKTLREVLSPRSKVASPKPVSHFRCVEKHPHPLFVTSKIESPRWSSYSPVLFANESGLMEQKLEAYRASTNSLVYGSSNMAGQRDGAGGKSPKVAAREKQVFLVHLAHHVIPRPPTATRSKRPRSPGADNSSSGKKKKKSKNGSSAATPLESLETAFQNKNQTAQKNGQVSNPDESVRSARSRSASSYHESRLSPGEANDSADDVSLLREIEAVLHYNKSRIEEIIVHQTAAGSGGSAQGGQDAGGDGREGGTARSRKGSDQEVAWHLSPEGKVVMSSRKSSKHSKGAPVEDHEATDKVVPAAGRADLASTSEHSLAVRKNTTAPAVIAAAPPLEKKLSQAAMQGAEIMPLAPVQSAIARSGFAASASQAVSGSELDQEIVARALSSASKEPQSGPDAQAHLDEQKEIALQALRSIRATLSTRGMSTSNFGSANDNSVNCSVESPLVSIPSTGAHQPHYHPNAGGPTHHLSSSGIYLQRASTMPTGGAAPLVARGVANPNPASCAIAEENDDDTLTDDPDALRREFSKRLELHSNLIKSLRHSLGVNEADSVSAEETPKVGMTPREQQPVLQRGDRPVLIPASPRFDAVEGGGEGAAVGTESGGGSAAGGSNNNEGRAGPGTAGAAPVRLISAGGTVSYVGFPHPGRILGPEDRSPRTSPRGGTTSPRQGAVKIVEQRGASAAVPEKDETSNSNKCQIRFDSSVPHDDAEDAGVMFLSASATNEDSMFLHTAKEQHTSASNSASAGTAENNFLFYEVPDRMAYIEERVERYLKGEDISPKRPWLLMEHAEGDAAGRVEAVVGAPLVQLQEDEEREHDVNDVNKLTSPRRVQPRPENSPRSVREVDNVARLFADEIAPPQRLSGAVAVVGTEEMQLRGDGNGPTALEAPKMIMIGESAAAVGDGAGDESPLDVAFIAEGELEQFPAACVQPQETRLVHVRAFPSGQQSLSQYAAPGGREPQYAQAVNGQYESVPDSPSIPSCGPSETILSALSKIKTENLRGSSTINMITAAQLELHQLQQATSRSCERAIAESGGCADDSVCCGQRSSANIFIFFDDTHTPGDGAGAGFECDWNQVSVFSTPGGGATDEQSSQWQPYYDNYHVDPCDPRCAPGRSDATASFTPWRRWANNADHSSYR
eukprot:g725.t1